MTTYQKLKKENAELKQKLRIVCLQPESQEAIMIVLTHQVHDKVDKYLMQGLSTDDKLKGVAL